MAALSVYDIIRIVAAGGGVEIDIANSSLSVYDLIRIASAAQGSLKGSTIRFKNAAELSPYDLIRIASAGRGSVEFVLN